MFFCDSEISMRHSIGDCETVCLHRSHHYHLADPFQKILLFSNFTPNSEDIYFYSTVMVRVPFSILVFVIRPRRSDTPSLESVYQPEPKL
jgi:hypothetical protein